MTLIIKAFKMHPRDKMYTWKFRILGHKATVTKWGLLLPQICELDYKLLKQSN